MVDRRILLVVPMLLAAAPAGAAVTGQRADVLRWHGSGVQIYDCQRTDTGYGWVLRQPDATLTDAAGHVSGHHGAGPSWTAADGSSITGRAITTIPAPDAGAIPWLVVEAASHAGHGTLDDVTYVLRTETQGGVAPADGCSAARLGAVTSARYQATYSFLRSPATTAAAAR